MVSKEYPRIGEKIYHAELPNGLHIYVDRRPEFQKSYAFFATNYGGMDMKFHLDGQWRDTPAGVAHFLEHKMFDTEDGNALQDLAANGASPNAFTSSALTGYYFESTEKFCDNLKILLSFVSIPWFTQESVDKEQGIIGQEIRMVEDDPDNQVFYGLMECLFDHHPIRVPIAGTQELRREVSTPIFQLGFKAEPAPAGEEHLRRQLMGELACEALLGNSSPLYARLYSEGLINKNFGYGFELYPGCALMAAGGESCDPRAVRDAVLAEGARIAQEGVDEGLFRRLKKGVYGAKVRGLNSFENVCIELAQAHFAGVEYLTFPEVFDGISKADVEDCIRRWVTPERCGLAVVRPGEEA